MLINNSKRKRRKVRGSHSSSLHLPQFNSKIYHLAMINWQTIFMVRQNQKKKWLTTHNLNHFRNMRIIIMLNRILLIWVDWTLNCNSGKIIIAMHMVLFWVVDVNIAMKRNKSWKCNKVNRGRISIWIE